MARPFPGKPSADAQNVLHSTGGATSAADGAYSTQGKSGAGSSDQQSCLAQRWSDNVYSVAFRFLIAVTSILLVFGAGGQATIGLTRQVELDSPTQLGPVGIQASNMDLTVDPGEDFYSFANGGWLADNELDETELTLGTLDEAYYEVGAQLFEIILDLEPDEDTAEGKARTLYDQVLDTRARNRDGIDPVLPLLDTIRDISSIEEGLAYQERSFQDNLNGLFIPYADIALDDATRNVAWLAGPFLKLPSEGHYLDDTDEAEEIRDAWVEATADLLVELGYDEDEAIEAAEAVLAFETDVARAKTPDAVMQSDPTLWDNPRTIEELEELLPGFDWRGFLEANGIADQEFLMVDDIAYLEALAGLLDDADPLVMQHLFATELAWAAAPYLTTDMDEIAFSFEAGTLFGIEEQGPIEGSALTAVATLLPDVLAELYVEEAFSPEAKAEIEDLVDHLLAAFRIRIEQNPWMGEETKAQALAKLDLISVKVGYPDEWESYDDVAVGDSLFETVANATAFANGQDLAMIGEPVDRDAWELPAFEVNAYYSATANEIVFPAGILQPPLYDPNADLASNYGAIGAVIGHEITHGFDLSGSQFDGYGNLFDWWTDADTVAFEDLNDQVADHYSDIEALPGLMVDGDLTVTENVADMGGVQVAYDGLMIALAEGNRDDRVWAYNQEQRFFIAWATTWRQLARDEFIELIVAIDEHAPAPVRAVEPLRHMDEFYEAFDIEPGDPMYLPPEDRIVIW
jgi:putative endopeptidase